MECFQFLHEQDRSVFLSMSCLSLRWRRGVVISSGLTCLVNFPAEECGHAPHLPALDLTRLTSARRCKFGEMNICGGILPAVLCQQHHEAHGGGGGGGH